MLSMATTTLPPATADDRQPAAPDTMESPEEPEGVGEQPPAPGSQDDSASAPSTGPGTPQKTPGFIESLQARVRPDEVYREEIVRSIFGEVGRPVEDFSCAVVSRILLHGRMYVTTSFICFYSNLFGFEKIIKIPFCHIRCITKEKTALFIPNAIAIITSRKEYIFRSFWDREDAFRTLKTYHQKTLAQQLPNPTGSGPQSRDPSHTSRERDSEQDQRRRRRRRSSSSAGGRASEQDGQEKGSKSGHGRRRLPWPGRGERHRSASAGRAQGDEHRRSWSGGSSTVSSSMSPRDVADKGTRTGSFERGSPDGSAAPSPDERDAIAASGSMEDAAAEAAGDSGGLESQDVSDNMEESEVDVLGVGGSPVGAVSSTSGGGQAPSKEDEFRRALAALADGRLVADGESDQVDQSNKGPATARITADLQCTLQQFFETFIANDADKGLPSFHEAQGDSDVQATPWKVAGGKLGMTREIRFVHPVTAPIGPNETRAVKLQRCRLYDEHGLIIETSTHLEDIAMSDYFHIEDRCVVQPAREGVVRVDVEIEVKFLKSTWFRKKIETQSLTESKEVWESFIDMARDVVKGMQRALPQAGSSEGDESQDEERMRATRERLRERRKRHRSRNHDRSADAHAPSANSTTPGHGSVRPRAKSAASRIPSTLNADGKGEGRGSHKGRATSTPKDAIPAQSAGSVRRTPIHSFTPWFLSFASIPWIILLVVLFWEGLQSVRFAGETKGYLEAAHTALNTLVEHAGREGAVKENAHGDSLEDELARGLVKIYCRNRFLWPLGKSCR